MMHRGIRLAPLYMLVTFFAVVATGAAEETRVLAGELDAAWDEGDAILEAYSRLLIERGTMRNYTRLDEIASTQLGMRYPQQVVWVDTP